MGCIFTDHLLPNLNEQAQNRIADQIILLVKKDYSNLEVDIDIIPWRDRPSYITNG